MTNIVGIVGSARPWGNSALLVRNALRGALAEGASAQMVRLTDLDLQSCTGCLRCVIGGRPCRTDDDMAWLIETMQAADGLVLAPEASAGCICLFPIVCSIALEPRPDYDRWGIYSNGGVNTPVQHMAINLGAPGDRRDANGTLWLGYPRPGLSSDRAAMGFSLRLGMNFVKEPEYPRYNSSDGEYG